MFRKCGLPISDCGIAPHPDPLPDRERGVKKISRPFGERIKVRG
jgi:hypothetical protein